MILKINDFQRIMEAIAPSELKESYDNVGLMVGETNKTVDKILVTLDCTLDVIKEAKDKGCNLILSHHPLLFKKPSSITDETLLGKKILNLIKSDIALYSSHTNLDSVCGGINDIITRVLGYENSVVMEKSKFESKGFNDKACGIGRIVELDKSMSLIELCKDVKNKLGIDNLRYCGEDTKSISKLAIVNGSGQDYFSLAKALGADCIITGDTSYHYISDFNEEGIAIIDAGHFATEWPAMRLFADILSLELTHGGYDVEILLSEKSKNPYKEIHN